MFFTEVVDVVVDAAGVWEENRNFSMVTCFLLEIDVEVFVGFNGSTSSFDRTMVTVVEAA